MCFMKPKEMIENAKNALSATVKYDNLSYAHPRTGWLVKKEELPEEVRDTTPVFAQVRYERKNFLYPWHQNALELPLCGKQLVPSNLK